MGGGKLFTKGKYTEQEGDAWAEVLYEPHPTKRYGISAERKEQERDGRKATDENKPSTE